MSQEEMISMKWHRKDWEFICEALDLLETECYAAPTEITAVSETYPEEAEKAHKIKEGIQYQLGNRSNKD